MFIVESALSELIQLVYRHTGLQAYRFTLRNILFKYDINITGIKAPTGTRHPVSYSISKTPVAMSP